MDAVLGRLQRARRRPGVAVAIAAAGLVAAAVLLVAVRGEDASTAPCEPSMMDAARVWSPALAAEVRARMSAAHEQVLAAAFRDWQASRAKACTAPPNVRIEQLQCLDGVLARIRTLRLAYLRVPGAAPDALQAQMVDPEVCRRSRPADVPQLTIRPAPGTIVSYALLGRSETEHKPSDAEIVAYIESSTTGPCERVISTLAFSLASQDTQRARALMVDAFGAAYQCGDERLDADLRIRNVLYSVEAPIIGPKGEAAITQAESASTRVMQPSS
jgi:hypothetical protein